MEWDESDGQNELLRLISSISVSRYTSAAATTLVLYDMLLTSSKEINLVWPGQLTLAKFLFLVNRYVVPCFLITITFFSTPFRPDLNDLACKLLVWITGVGLAVVHVCAMLMTTLRATAIFRDHPKVVKSIWVLFGGCFLASQGFCLLTMITVHGHMFYWEPANTCLTHKVFLYMFAPPVPPILFELVITILTSINAYNGSEERGGSRLIQMFVRDGLIYFIIVIAAGTWLMIWVLLPRAMLFLGIHIYFGLLATFTSRFFLDIRTSQNKYNYTVYSTSYSSHTHNGFAFRPRSTLYTDMYGTDLDDIKSSHLGISTHDQTETYFTAKESDDTYVNRTPTTTDRLQPPTTGFGMGFGYSGGRDSATELDLRKTGEWERRAKKDNLEDSSSSDGSSTIGRAV